MYALFIAVSAGNLLRMAKNKQLKLLPVVVESDDEGNINGFEAITLGSLVEKKRKTLNKA